MFCSGEMVKFELTKCFFPFLKKFKLKSYLILLKRHAPLLGFRVSVGVGWAEGMGGVWSESRLSECDSGRENKLEFHNVIMLIITNLFGFLSLFLIVSD